MRTAIFAAGWLAASLLANAQPQARFKPAVFSGLTVGKATIKQLESKLGRPVEKFDDRQGTIWLYYSDVGSIPGRVEIIASARSGVVSEINLTPTDLTLAQAKEIFGTAYRIARFSFDSCLGDGESSPIYEDPNGTLEFVIYDALGVVLYPRKNGVVIEYLGQPIGAKTSQCKGKAERKLRFAR